MSTNSATNPPVPAPYLAGLPQLEVELGERPSPAAVAKARRVITRLRLLIRMARRRYERAAGVVIEPEPTWKG